LILWTALASVFSLLLGYSRIPYAAALDGGFFRVFGRVHPTKHFPVVSLLLMGGLTTVFSLFGTLQGVIKGLLALRILVQFEGQVVAVMLLRRRGTRLPFRMWLYPLPALVALVGWLYAFWSLGNRIITLGLSFVGLGVIAYLLRAAITKGWPFTGVRAAPEGE
jgi:amino acid transporter